MYKKIYPNQTFINLFDHQYNYNNYTQQQEPVQKNSGNTINDHLNFNLSSNDAENYSGGKYDGHKCTKKIHDHRVSNYG